MAGYGLHRLWPIQQTCDIAADGQHWQNMQACRRCWCRPGPRPERVGGIRRSDVDLLIHHPQSDIRDHAEEAAFLPFDGHVAADRHILDRS